MKKKKALSVLQVIGALLVALIMLLPLIYGVSTSFKTEKEIYKFPPDFLPQQPSAEGYREVLKNSHIPRQMGNSIKIAAYTIIVTVAVGSLAGYAFARARFRGKGILLAFLIGMQMIPGLSNVITLYVMGNKLKLLNTHFYLVLIYSATSTPTCIWLMKSYFEQIPASLEEAAMVDGCTRIGALLRVVAPLARMGMAACSMLVFVSAWNEFLVSMTMISRTKLKTFTVGLQAFIQENTTNWVNMAAATVLGLIPVLILFLSFQKTFIAGMTSGAVKA